MNTEIKKQQEIFVNELLQDFLPMVKQSTLLGKQLNQLTRDFKMTLKEVQLLPEEQPDKYIQFAEKFLKYIEQREQHQSYLLEYATTLAGKTQKIVGDLEMEG